MISTKEKMEGLAHLELAFPTMTLSQLRSRIEAAVNDGNFVIEYNMRNGFARWEEFEDDQFIASPGVAVALAFVDECTPELTDRGARARRLGWGWYYLMHFEMAINSLFAGDIRAYNHTEYFPRIDDSIRLPKITAENIDLLYKAMK